MKITYEFDNGDVVIVEASERIGKWILASRRREASDDKYHHRYCYSLDAVNDKSSWAASNENNPDEIIDRMIAQIEEEADREEKRRRFRSAMKYLTKKEQDLLNAMIYDRKTRADYAREHKLDKSTVYKRYRTALKKIQNKI